MIVTRREMLVAALGAAGAAALGAVALTVGATPGGAAVPANGYAPIRKPPGAPPLPRRAALNPTGDMIMRSPNGRWTSHLLPFADPSPDQESLKSQIAQMRARGLFR